MPDDKSKIAARQLARQHTAHLLEMLQGKAPVTAASTSAPTLAPPPSPQTTEPPRLSRTRTVCYDPPPANPPPSKPVGQKAKALSVGATLGKTGTHLDNLVQQTLRLAKLNRIFRSLLPSHLQEHANLARLDAEAWVVQTDSSVWASRLRYALPDLRKTLGLELGMALPRPRIRIAPPAVPEAPPPPSRRMTVTANTVNVLEGAAQTVADPRLGAAMLRLAEHARETRDNPR